jgi:hypothetical protein
MRLDQSKETEGVWYVRDNDDNIIRVFYSKQRAANFIQMHKIKKRRYQ